ncbi:MAG: hypothetical protein AAF602_17925 [Myxococcota bacterium]
MWLLWIGSVALAGEGLPSRWQEPNVVVGVGAGRPALISVRAEAWLSSQFSAEFGFGVPAIGFDELAGDFTLRFRPDALCVGCGGQDLLTFGFGVAGVGTAVRGFDEWALAIGPDVAVTGVHWFTPELGVHATVRGGLGPSLVSPSANVEAVDWWSFGVLGLSF